MAYYGIPSAGLALTASDSNDKISVSDLGGTLVTAQSVYGGDGNDVISLGAVGYTATAKYTGTLTNTTGLGNHTLTGIVDDDSAAFS